MRDRTEQIRSAVSTYSALKFIPLRLENAFDDSWWSSVGGRPSTEDLMVDLSDEGVLCTTLFTRHL